MTRTPAQKAFRVLRLTALLLVASVVHGGSVVGQSQTERFWLGGRYDGNRIVVYFDKVKFNGTMLPIATMIPPPVADGFFSPNEVPPSYLARFLTGRDVEHFAIGDRYDVLTAGGTLTMTLTSLVGCETDEAVGNDSFVGALATVEGRDELSDTNLYYVVRRHQEPRGRSSSRTASPFARRARLIDEPVRMDIQTRIAQQLTLRMKTEATQAERVLAGNVQPAVMVQRFHVAGGSVRYYVRAEWRSGREPKNTEPFALAAWMTTLPTLRILAVEGRTSPYGFDSALPRLLNVVDLGNGRAGVIVHINGLDSVNLTLVEYRDGVGLEGMPGLQSIFTGE